MVSSVQINLCDNLNPSIGYSIRVINDRGETVLFASKDPQDCSDLLTLDDALRVAGYYAGREPDSDMRTNRDERRAGA